MQDFVAFICNVTACKLHNTCSSLELCVCDIFTETVFCRVQHYMIS